MCVLLPFSKSIVLIPLMFSNKVLHAIKKKKKNRPINAISVRIFPALNPVAHINQRHAVGRRVFVTVSSVRKLCLFSLDGLFSSTDTAEKESVLLKSKVIVMIGSVHWDNG